MPAVHSGTGSNLKSWGTWLTEVVIFLSNVEEIFGVIFITIWFEENDST